MTFDQDTLLYFVVGALGTCVRVAIGHDKGERQSFSKIAATVITGTTLAGTSNQAMVEYLHLPPSLAGAAAFLIGLLSIGFVYKALDGKIPLINKIMGGE